MDIGNLNTLLPLGPDFLYLVLLSVSWNAAVGFWALALFPTSFSPTYYEENKKSGTGSN